MVTGADSFQGEFDKLLELFNNNIWDIVFKLVAIVLIIVVAKLLIVVVKRSIKRMIVRRKNKSPDSMLARKSETVLIAYQSVAKYLIYFFALISILSVLELIATVTSIIAAAGIGGIIIGFGAQKLVQDFFSGFFMLFEDQFSVGDYINIAGVDGIVESVTIRTTIIKNFTGELITIPNGSIDKVINFSRGNVVVFLETCIAHDSDIEKAMECINATVCAYKENNEHLVSEAKVLGVSEIINSGIKIKYLVSVKPLNQWATQRELNKLVYEALHESGINTAYMQNIAVANV